jgi:molecular chaperone DnaK
MPYVLGVDVGPDRTAAAACRLDGPPEPAPLFDPVETALDGVCGFLDRVGDDVPLVIGGGRHLAHDLCAALVAWIVGRARAAYGELPAHVVLTHPAEWGPYRREALRRALLRQGVEPVTALPSPVVLAHGRGLVAVLDLGAAAPSATVVSPSGAILGHAAAADPVCVDDGAFARVGAGVLRRALRAAAVDAHRLDSILLTGAPASLGGVAALVGAQFRVRVTVDGRPELSTSSAAALAARRAVAPPDPTTVRARRGALAPTSSSRAGAYPDVLGRAGTDPEGSNDGAGWDGADQDGAGWNGAGDWAGAPYGPDEPPPRPPVRVRPLELPPPRLAVDRPVVMRALTSAAAVAGVALTLMFFRHDDAHPPPIVPASTQPAAGVPPLVVPTTTGPRR